MVYNILHSKSGTIKVLAEQKWNNYLSQQKWDGIKHEAKMK